MPLFVVQIHFILKLDPSTLEKIGLPLEPSQRAKSNRDWLRVPITGQLSDANRHGNNCSRRHRRSFLQRLVINRWRHCPLQRRWVMYKGSSLKRYSQELPWTLALATLMAMVCISYSYDFCCMNPGAYHYHANINCTDAGAATGANDSDECVLIGDLDLKIATKF